MSGQYLAVDIEACRRAGHQFIIAGSDKTPRKKNVICRTCTDRNPGKTAYAAYGDDVPKWGEFWYTLLVPIEAIDAGTEPSPDR